MEDESIVTELATQGSITFIGNLFQYVAGFFFLLVTTRFLSSDLFGVFVIGLSIVSVFSGLSNLSIYRCISFFVPQYLKNEQPEKAKGTIYSALTIAMCGSTIGTIVVIAVSPQLSQLFEEDLLVAILPPLSLLIFLQSINQISLSSFSAVKRMDFRVFLRGITFPFIRIVGSLFFLFLGFSVFSLVIGQVLATGITAILGIGIFLTKINWFKNTAADFPPSQDLIRYSIPLAMAGLVTTLLGQIDYLIIGYFLQPESVGIYRVSYELGASLIIAISAITPIFKPLIAEVIDDDHQIKIRYQLATRWATILTFPIFITLVLAPHTYLTLFFTGDFNSGWSVVIIISLGYLINALNGPEGMVLEGLGYTRVTFANTLILLVINISLDLLLVPKFGIIGAGLATSIAIATSASAGVIEVWYYKGILPFSFNSLKLWASGMVTYVITLPLTLLITADLLLAICLPIFTPIVYLFTIRVTNGFSQEDSVIINLIDEKIGHPFFQKLLL